ncbi:hypothetical protein V8F20_006538 [Naviculisporaceae sp. PSN 640]
MCMTTIIRIIPQDEEGVAFYLAYYKPFRLRALETDPSAFSSTYEREVSFDDEKWRSRIMNPLATTLIAGPGNFRGEAAVPILSATTVVGPLPLSGPLDQRINDPRLKGARKVPRYSQQRYEINAVWTAPEARRTGLAARLMQEAINHVREQARDQARQHSQSRTQAAPAPRTAEDSPDARLPEIYLDVGVEKTNEAAMALYRKSGFVPYFEDREDIVQGGNTIPRKFLYMYLPVEY